MISLQKLEYIAFISFQFSLVIFMTKNSLIWQLNVCKLLSILTEKNANLLKIIFAMLKANFI